MEAIRQLAAGVICAGFEGDGGDATAACGDLPLGGFVLFSRNADSVQSARAVTDVLRQRYKELPPILAIDQEGGRVARLRGDALEIPSARAIGATAQPELARRSAAQTGHDLRRAGLNLDFAPVLDLALLSDNTVIGDRAFSSDPRVVTDFGRAFANGLRSAGIVPTFKHFPGHGSTAVDSHTALPVVEVDRATLYARDLIPFANLLPTAEAVMTAHIDFRAFDSESPATLSRTLLTVVLREEFSFKGVCFTDCMQMDAIAKTVGSEEASVRALAAGADCILISNGIDLAKRMVAAIENAIESHRLPFERLQEAYNRVCALRRGLKDPIPLESASPDDSLAEDIARTVTVH
ncbi:MAG: beta-N-acetylhexosaminidase [Candidatus Eremiobacteraeota bacterium]|nr:beta-N-acetylhexosaminidase [Candidatus Eremiobacteraeota bacterium]